MDKSLSGYGGGVAGVSGQTSSPGNLTGFLLRNWRAAAGP